MKKLLLKIMVPGLLVVSVFSLGIVYTRKCISMPAMENIVSLAAPDTNVIDPSISKDIKDIDTIVSSIDDWFDQFLSKNNYDSYNTHVTDLKKRLDVIEQTMLRPTQEQIVNSDTADTKSVLRNDMHTIRHSLYDALHKIYAVLVANREYKALANALKKIKEGLQPSIKVIDNKLSDIHTRGQHYTMLFGDKIQMLGKKIHNLFNNKGMSNLELWSRITHRFKCGS